MDIHKPLWYPYTRSIYTPRDHYVLVVNKDELMDLRSGLSWMDNETGTDHGVMYDKLTEALCKK